MGGYDKTSHGTLYATKTGLGIGRNRDRSAMVGRASATLGEPESSLTAETQLNRASIKQSDYGSYRVHEMQLPSGTVLREYAAPDGKIFAVTWNGPFIPNLKQTLGSYFAEFSAEAPAAHGTRNISKFGRPIWWWSRAAT